MIGTSKSKPSTSSFQFTATVGNVYMVNELLNNGADVHARDSQNSTALHHVVSHSHDSPDVVETLINAGAIVDARDDDQCTPLHRALMTYFNKSAKKLIDRGASMVATEWRGWTSLHLATYHRNLMMMDSLIKYGMYVNVETSSGVTPLHLAVAYCKEDVVSIY